MLILNNEKVSRFIFIVALLVFITFVAFGCFRADAKASEVKIDRFETIDSWFEDGRNYYLVYDKETKVEYFVLRGDTQSGICPRYDKNGEIMLYEGEN